METTTTKTTKAGQAGFIPIEGITDNLDNVSANEPINDPNIEAIEPIISLGAGKGKKILLDVEDGIKTFVQDGLAAKNHAISELRRMYPAFKIKRIGGIMVEQL